MSRTHAQRLSCVSLLAFFAWATPARAESGRLNLHFEGAFGGVVTGAASHDPSMAQRSIGGIGMVGLDYEFFRPFAVDLLIGGGAFAKPFPEEVNNAGLFTVAVGGRVRLLDDTRGFLNDPGGRLHGNLYVAGHIGYLHFDGAQVGVDLSVGYEASVFRPLSLGPFLRVIVAPGGTNPGVDTVVVAGLAISLEVLGPPGDRDRDGDGLSDGEERDWNTDPTRADTDGDGIPDGAEVEHGTDPHEADSDDDTLEDGAEDRNHDGVLDADETDPRRRDTDGGGVGDGDEVRELHTNPRDRSDDDRDGDGVAEFADFCPNTPAGSIVDANGCVDITARLVLSSVTFAEGRSRLDPSAEGALRQAQELVLAHPTLRFTVLAWVDPSGDAVADAELSRRRAETVVEWLVEQGIPRDRLDPDGEGAGVASEGVPAARIELRRIP